MLWAPGNQSRNIHIIGSTKPRIDMGSSNGLFSSIQLLRLLLRSFTLQPDPNVERVGSEALTMEMLVVMLKAVPQLEELVDLVGVEVLEADKPTFQGGVEMSRRLRYGGDGHVRAGAGGVNKAVAVLALDIVDIPLSIRRPGGSSRCTVGRG